MTTAAWGKQEATQEIVAETVAAVLCHLFDLDGSLTHAAEYIKSYANGENPGRAAMRCSRNAEGAASPSALAA